MNRLGVAGKKRVPDERMREQQKQLQEEINAGAARVRELGGEANAPRPVQGMGWFSTCKDTHGNEFGLWQNDPSAPAEPTA